MTAHKHFKSLVRARMAKTGESYSTARRFVIRHADGVASNDVAPNDSAARWHLPGNVPAATALRVLLAAAGIREPESRRPLPESLVFGIAGGIGIGVCQFFYEKEDFATFYVAGRHHWHDDAGYLSAAASRLGLKATVRESSGAKAAEKNLREALAEGRPCVAFVDMAHLPHRAMPPRFSGGGYHLVTVYEVDDTTRTARIGDLTDQPLGISLADLAAARARIKKFKNRVVFLSQSEAAPDLSAAVLAGLRASHTGLIGKPMKGFPTTFSLEGVRLWGERLHGSKDKEAWERVFTRGHRLWAGLTGIHDYIEHYGTGGGLCRPMFAEFLEQAAVLTRRPKLKALAGRYAELGEAWSELASAALPADIPMFREYRDLVTRRGELLAGAGEGNVEALRDTWARMDALAQRARREFPLPERKCAELRAELQQRVRAIHEGEAAAHAALGAALG